MNSMQTDSSFSIPTVNPHTFSQQSAAWIHELESRKRKPVAPATLAVFNSYVRRLLPIVGPNTPLGDIDNGFVRDLVTKLVAEKLSPKTIAELVATVKQVVASAVDANGNCLFPRRWNAKFLDLPQVQNQKQPCATTADVETCIKTSRNHQERLLYALLAGSGLRIAEALAIHVGGSEKQTSWDNDASAISVKSSIYRGKEHNRVKTLAAIRTVDLDPRLNELIATFVAANNIRTGQLLFQSRNGGPMNLKTATDRLKKHGLKGFQAFRRYRITWLREAGCPEDILKFWVGHSGSASITDRYCKLSENVELRKKFAGLCFDLPTFFAGDPQPSSTKRPNPPKLAKSPRNPTPSDVAEVEPIFQATDADLDPLFFAPVQEQV
jgi:integrase